MSMVPIDAGASSLLRPSWEVGSLFRSHIKAALVPQGLRAGICWEFQRGLGPSPRKGSVTKMIIELSLIHI